MMTGGCLCGGVRYRIDDVAGPLVYCHCTQCRKAQGVGFAANVPVAEADFAVTEGSDLVAAYRSSATKLRCFCSRCGSPLFSQVDGKPVVRVRAGSLDARARVKPGAHIFTASKAPWQEITDELPRYDEREPGRA